MSDDGTLQGPDLSSREVVESFLQNIVILDDVVIMSKQGQDWQEEVPETTLRSPQYPDKRDERDEGVTSERPGAPLNANTVTGAFADRGMACTVLTADQDSAFPARTVKVASRADMVVLDWKIADSDGDTTLELMKTILSDDQNANRLRLMAIYTGEPNLDNISSRVQDVLEGFYCSSRTTSVDRFRLSKGPVRIVILAKDGTIGDHASSLGYIQVAEENLADKLIDEFASMTSGLLRNVALAGIATIRQQSYRLLARFDDALDSAYLGHRMLLSHPPDAEGHLVEALASELLSILEQCRPGAHADIGAIERWLNVVDELDISQPFGFNSSVDPVHGWLGLLQQGVDAEDAELHGLAKKQLRSRATEPFATDEAAARRADFHFAALLSLKTRYPGYRPRLAVGSILCVENQGNPGFLLCLQPKCDSTRLESVSRFSFVELKAVRDGDSKLSFLVAVETAEGEWRRLGVELNPVALMGLSFVPGVNPPGEVVATADESGMFHFVDANNTKYRWIAELKDEHAFRVVGAVTASLARPGPNDAEWLRRAARQ